MGMRATETSQDDGKAADVLGPAEILSQRVGKERSPNDSVTSTPSDLNAADGSFQTLFVSVLPALHGYLARQCELAEIDDVASEIMGEVYIAIGPPLPQTLKNSACGCSGSLATNSARLPDDGVVTRPR